MYRTSKHENNCFYPRCISHGDDATRLMSHTNMVAKSARVQKLRNCTEAKRLIEKNKTKQSVKKTKKYQEFMEKRPGHGGEKKNKR